MFSLEYAHQSIKTIVPRIIEYARPKSIVLFGSALHGTSDGVNDLDFLVIVPDAINPSTVADSLNINLRNKPMPCDFVVATPSQIKKHRSDSSSIYTVAMEEGREVYARL
jgi:predicted nucleotidyltransferase